MKITEEVLKNIRPVLENLEVERLLYKQKKGKLLKVLACIYGGVILLVLILSVFNIQTSLVAAICLIIFITVIGVSYYFLMANPIRVRYIYGYKVKVVPQILKSLKGDYTYEPEGRLSIHEFENSELYRDPDRYTSKNFIRGKCDKTHLEFAEVHAEKKQKTRDSEGKSKIEYITIFKGIFFIADFHKNFHGRTFITPDFAEKKFGLFGRKFQKIGGQKGTRLTQMDDTEFEKEFVINTTDEIECRYILTSAMMQNILQLKERFSTGEVKIAFKDSKILIALPINFSYLEPTIQVPATEAAQIKTFIDEINLFISIVEELNLNTRIWSKH